MFYPTNYIIPGCISIIEDWFKKKAIPKKALNCSRGYLKLGLMFLLSLYFVSNNLLALSNEFLVNLVQLFKR